MWVPFANAKATHILVSFAEKLWVAFAKLTFFIKNISVYATLNDQNFNDTLTNDIDSFEQLGPGLYSIPDQNITIYRAVSIDPCFVLLCWHI